MNNPFPTASFFSGNQAPCRNQKPQKDFPDNIPARISWIRASL
jgi:hypothetical protein